MYIFLLKLLGTRLDQQLKSYLWSTFNCLLLWETFTEIGQSSSLPFQVQWTVTAWMRVVPLPKKGLVQISRKYSSASNLWLGILEEIPCQRLGSSSEILCEHKHGREKSDEIKIGKAFQGTLVLPMDGCPPSVWLKWGAGTSLPSEVPGRWSVLNCTASLFAVLLAYRSIKMRIS